MYTHSVSVRPNGVLVTWLKYNRSLVDRTTFLVVTLHPNSEPPETTASRPGETHVNARTMFPGTILRERRSFEISNWYFWLE